MPYMQIRDCRLFYAAHKAENSLNSLVLIHGAAGSHLDWPGDLRRLTDASVFAIDLPGHGRSSGPARSTISEYAEDILEIVNTVGVQRQILVGFSMGSAIALMAALRSGSFLGGLALIGSAPRLQVSPVLLENLAINSDAALQFIIKYSWSKNAPDLIVDRAREQLSKVPTATIMSDYVACNGFDIKDQLALIKVPTLVISASNDRMTPPRFGQALAAGIPNSRMFTIADAGHMVILEKPDELTDSIQQFVTDISQQRRT